MLKASPPLSRVCGQYFCQSFQTNSLIPHQSCWIFLWKYITNWWLRKSWPFRDYIKATFKNIFFLNFEARLNLKLNFYILSTISKSVWFINTTQDQRLYFLSSIWWCCVLLHTHLNRNLKDELLKRDYENSLNSVKTKKDDVDMGRREKVTTSSCIFHRFSMTRCKN